MNGRTLSRTATAVDRVVQTDDGARLAVTVTRPSLDFDAGTVVLAHGWAAGRQCWQPVTRHLLALGHTVVAYDHRGHGESTLGREPIGVPRLGADLSAVLTELDVRDAVLAGHSGGGFAALAYVTADPGAATSRLRGLALLATAAHDQATPAGEVRMMGSGLFTWALSRPPVGRKMLRATMGRWIDPAALETHRQMFAATPAAVRAACFGCTQQMDLRSLLAKVQIPAVVVAGDADTVVAPSLGRAVADALPHARYELLPGAGHMLPLERPARVATVIADLAAR
ncbi:alpha/beta fold hydrolase [Micromonospora sp. NPDC051925]|uniref:alpha/beta fold hydrolase n=1 Tax=Micromonospora sp. NPDC051925 TaxID=3364288 RepID=UPI0037CAD6CF